MYRMAWNFDREFPPAKLFTVWCHRMHMLICDVVNMWSTIVKNVCMKASNFDRMEQNSPDLVYHQLLPAYSLICYGLKWIQQPKFLAIWYNLYTAQWIFLGYHRIQLNNYYFTILLILRIWQVSAWDKIHSNCGPCGPDDKVIDELFVALRKKIPPPNGDTGCLACNC